MTIFLSWEKLVSYLSNTFFDEIVRNDFVLHRETIGDVMFLPFPSQIVANLPDSADSVCERVPA